MKVFSVYDSKAEAYEEMFTLRETAEGQRWFAMQTENEKTKVGKWPEDHTLFELGEWDERTGTIKLYEAKKSLGLALQYKKKPEDNSQLELQDAINKAIRKNKEDKERSESRVQ